MIRQGPVQLRSGLTISEKQADAITEALSKMMGLIPARFALISDISGQIVGAMGDYNKANLLAISSLVVGDLAASQEIARLTGEYHDQQVILREGQKACTLIAEAGEHLVLFVQISNEVPLGWARITVLQTTKKLAEIERQQPSNAEDTTTLKLDLGLEGENLSDLFENALDDIWTE